MKKYLLVLLLTFLCNTAFGAPKESGEFQVPFVVIQKSECGKLTINWIKIKVSDSYTPDFYIQAEAVYENTTDTVFCSVDMRATAFDWEGTVIGGTTGYILDSSSGLIKPGMKVKLEFLLRLQGEVPRLKNVIFSFQSCSWRDRDNPGLKK